MNGTLAITKRELRSFFTSPIAYIVLGIFLMLTGGLYFFFNLFPAGQASMRGCFSAASAFFIFLVPAVTMRAFAEERKSGTLELLLTMPLHDWQFVAGKFLASLAMVSVGLVWTVPYAFTVAGLAAPGVAFDWGPVLAGYVGLLLVAAVFIAVGLWVSALSRNQIVAFIVTFAACLVLYLIHLLAYLLPDSLGQVFEYLSVGYHFENIARGVLDTRDILYYLSLTAVGLLLTTGAVASIRQELTPKAVASPSVFVLAVVGSLVLLNVLSLRLFARFDATADGAFTLAKASRDTVSQLEEPVVITAYFTANLPPPYSSNERYVRDLLDEFRAASKGKISYEVIDPASQESEKDKETKREVKQDIFGRRFREPTAVEKELASSGVQPVEIRVVEDDQQQTKRAYMGVVIRHNEKREVIPLVQGVESLEYDLTSLIRKLTRTKTPVIAVLQGHEEPAMREHFGQFSTKLSQTYQVRPVELAGKDRFDADVDAVFVLGPKKALAPNEVKAIDQLLMAGKSAAFFLDSVHLSLRTMDQSPAEHGLGALLATYGITITDQMVADVNSASINVSEQRGFMVVSMPVPYPFVPVVKRLEGDSPVAHGLGEVAFPFASKISATAEEGRQVVVLARSSSKSWVEGKPQNLDPRRDWRSETITTNGPHDLMVQVSGKLKSHFAAEAGQSTASGGTPVVGESAGEARLIVAGTSALFQDDFMRGGPNQALLLNIADWMLLDPALLAMRTRGLAVATLKPELSDSIRNATKFGNALGLPLALAMLGLVRWRMREARRQHVTL